MNISDSNISPSEGNVDLLFKSEFPNSPSSGYNFCPSPMEVEQRSPDLYKSNSSPSSPQMGLSSSSTSHQSPPSPHTNSDSPILPRPLSPEPLSPWSKEQPKEHETEASQRGRLSPEPPPPLPASQSHTFQHSSSQIKRESPPSISIHPVTKRSSSATEFPIPSVSLIPFPLPLTANTPLLTGDKPNEELHQSSHSLFNMSLNTQTNSSSDSQFIDESCIYRLSPRLSQPFYSLSPKSELSLSSDSKSPLVPHSLPLSPLVSYSHSPSPLPNSLGENEVSIPSATVSDAVPSSTVTEAGSVLLKQEDEKIKVQESIAIDFQNDTVPSSSSLNKRPSLQIQEPPCIVDLTGEDDEIDGSGGCCDDEIEIVSTDQPVVFLGRESSCSSSTVSSSRRLNRKRKRHDSQRMDTNSVEETIVINDSIQEESVLLEGPSCTTTSTTVINVADSPETSRTDDTNGGVNNSIISSSSTCSNNSSRRNNSGIFEMNDPGQLFGDLLNPSVVALDNHNSSIISLPREPVSQSIGCTCPAGSSEERSTTAGIVCTVHHRSTSLPVLPLNRPSSREEQSYSREEESYTLPISFPRPSSLLESTIPQDVLNDIESLIADEVRDSGPYLRNFFMGPPGGGASSSAVDFVRSRRQRAGSVARNSPRLTATTEVGLYQTSTFQPTMPSAIRPPVNTPGSSTSSSAYTPAAADVSDDSGGLSCPICFESFQEIKNASKSLSSTVCGHIFCTSCLEASLKQVKQCPTCRKRLRKKQYHLLYI